MKSIHNREKQHAMTLAELLVALAILAILTSIGISGFSALVAETRMTSQVNNLVHNLHLARQKARLYGIEIALCQSVDQQQCDAEADWHAGWIMFANRDRDDPPQLDAGEEMLATGDATDHVRVSANRRAFIMRPFGKRSTNGTFVYCDHRGAAAAQAIIVSYTGKPRVRRTSSSGRPLTCPSAPG